MSFVPKTLLVRFFATALLVLISCQLVTSSSMGAYSSCSCESSSAQDHAHDDSHGADGCDCVCHHVLQGDATVYRVSWNFNFMLSLDMSSGDSAACQQLAQAIDLPPQIV